jgi:hypothetical protein
MMIAPPLRDAAGGFVANGLTLPAWDGQIRLFLSKSSNVSNTVVV